MVLAHSTTAGRGLPLAIGDQLVAINGMTGRSFTQIAQIRRMEVLQRFNPHPWPCSRVSNLDARQKAHRRRLYGRASIDRV